MAGWRERERKREREEKQENDSLFHALYFRAEVTLACANPNGRTERERE